MRPADLLGRPEILLLAIPVIAFLFLACARRGRIHAAVPLPGFEWLPCTSRRGRLRDCTSATLRALALLALIPLVAGPLDKVREEKRTGAGALVILLDNSSSMTAADFQPFNRLDAAKRSVKSFLARLPDIGIGLVALAGSPQMVAPITRDRRFVLAALDRIGPAAYEEDGTAIGTGAAGAVNRFRYETGGPRRLLLITDGVSNRGNVSSADAAEVARMMGVRVDAIGIGTDAISRFSVPTVEGSQQEVEAKIEIDDRALDDLVSRTGGEYSRVRNLAELEKSLARLEETYSRPERPDTRSSGPNWSVLLILLALASFGAEMLFRHFVIREIPQ